jgi:hypothetical protein
MPHVIVVDFCIELRRRERSVSEQFLHDANIHALLEQGSRIEVAERMARERAVRDTGVANSA